MKTPFVSKQEAQDILDRAKESYPKDHFGRALIPENEPIRFATKEDADRFALFMSQRTNGDYITEESK